MSSNKNLLLPYALNNDGDLVHIDNANKDEKYTCPVCGSELCLRQSRLPIGSKFYKRSHFAHLSDNTNYNKCSESFLHKLFKERCADFISDKIKKQESIIIKWNCDICREKHQRNLIENICDVKTEYRLNECIPDIALLDDKGNLVSVIEIIFTHKPEENVTRFYKENNILCIEIIVKDFEDCDKIQEKLSEPSKINLCPNPKCDTCHQHMHEAKLVVYKTKCWNCNEEMNIVAIINKDGGMHIGPENFTEEELTIAIELGVDIRNCYSYTSKQYYNANYCAHCNNFIGANPLHNYLGSEIIIEHDLGYKCFNCCK